MRVWTWLDSVFLRAMLLNHDESRMQISLQSHWAQLLTLWTAHGHLAAGTSGGWNLVVHLSKPGVLAQGVSTAYCILSSSSFFLIIARSTVLTSSSACIFSARLFAVKKLGDSSQKPWLRASPVPGNELDDCSNPYTIQSGYHHHVHYKEEELRQREAISFAQGSRTNIQIRVRRQTALVFSPPALPLQHQK